MGELYLAHQQGAGGAAKLLANPDAPVEAVIGPEAARNNGATPGMTAGQFASKWTGKFSDLGAPQIVDGNQPSPLDTAQFPAGPVGAPVGDADPVALPANSQPAQGYAVPGQSARPAINPVILKEMMTSPYASDTERKIGMALFGQYMDQQAKANDPLRRLEIQQKMNALTPFSDPYKDADGNLLQKGPLGKATMLSAADKRPSTVCC